MKPVLSVKNLSKSYPASRGWAFWRTPPAHEAIHNVSLDVKPGEIFGLLGPNGAGKSTLINMLTGIMTPDSGSIRLFGESFTGVESHLKQRTNLVAGHTKLIGWLSIQENLRVFAGIYNVKNPQQRIDSVLAKLELSDIKHQAFQECSSGQKTRAMIAKGLINEPDLLFLDEPTIGLDPDIAETARSAILTEQERTGMSVILTSHYMQDVEEMCDRIGMLISGKMFSITTPGQMRGLITEKHIEIWFKGGIQSGRAVLLKKKMDIVSDDGERITIRVPQHFSINSILKPLTATKAHIASIHTHDPDLEQVFISLSRGELR